MAGVVCFYFFVLSTLMLTNFSAVTAQQEGRTSLKAIIDLLFNVGRDYYVDDFGQPAGHNRYDCPLCDSSVYSYCSEKLLHDACCCLNPYEHNLPRQCKYADCSFLHANTCDEHRLITACCCSRRFH